MVYFKGLEGVGYSIMVSSAVVTHPIISNLFKNILQLYKF